MAGAQNALPSDEAVCATMRDVQRERMNILRLGLFVAGAPRPWLHSTDFIGLYGGSCRRACAHLRELVDLGLMETEKHHGRTYWRPTPAGEKLADLGQPGCTKCGSPVEPDLDDDRRDLCRACLADHFDWQATRDEKGADQERESARRYKARAKELKAGAEMRRARAETLRHDGDVLLRQETF